MAATPSHPASSEVRAGAVMSVMLGVILAHTGLVDLALIHPHTSSRMPQSCPIAIPMRRSGIPCGQLAQRRWVSGWAWVGGQRARWTGCGTTTPPQAAGGWCLLLERAQPAAALHTTTDRPAPKVDLKRVDASVFAPLDQLVPRRLAVLFHDGRNQHAVWELGLELLELGEHRLQRAVGDELNVLPPNHLLVVRALHFGVPAHSSSRRKAGASARVWPPPATRSWR